MKKKMKMKKNINYLRCQQVMEMVFVVVVDVVVMDTKFNLNLKV